MRGRWQGHYGSFLSIIINDIGKSTGLKQIFLTIDIGHYGSDGFRHGSKSERAIEEQVEEFLSTIYGRNMSLGEWEETYITHLVSRDCKKRQETSKMKTIV